MHAYNTCCRPANIVASVQAPDCQGKAKQVVVWRCTPNQGLYELSLLQLQRSVGATLSNTNYFAKLMICPTTLPPRAVVLPVFSAYFVQIN